MNIQSDNQMVKILMKWINIFSFGVLYILCCLPLITVGAATISLTVITRRMKEGKAVVYSDFLKGIKQYFRQGTILWVITVLGIGITIVSFSTYRMFDPISWPLYLLGLGMGTLCVLMIPWLFGCAGYFETDSGHMLVFAYYLSLKHLGYTFLMMIVVYGIMIIGLLTVVILPVIPGIIIYLQAGIFNRIFNQYERKTLQVISRTEDELMQGMEDIEKLGKE